MNRDVVTEATKNLGRSGVKTYLTLLGIVIGIAAIVSLVSIGSGLGIAVGEQLDQLGGTTILVIPTGYQNIRTRITETDLSRIDSIRGVDSSIPIYSTSGILEFDRERINVSINAVDADDASLFDGTGFFEIKEGRDFTRNETGTILIGHSVANDYFSRKIETRKLVSINGEEFRVIGILAPQAQAFGGGPDTGNTVYMSLDAFKRISETDNPSIIFVSAIDKDSVEFVSDEIRDYFEDKYGRRSVSVMSSDSILETVNSILGVITIFIMGLAGISLVVGGIGIMNAMITSVIERTQEIGLMKALGASSNKILTLFLLEAAFIGIVGGVIGILIGFGLAELVAFVGTQTGFALVAVKNFEIIFGALAFSVIAGVLSGLYPAMRASKLDPVEALRYE